MKWRAWYTDGRAFSSEDGAFQGLPETGLLFLIHYKEKNGYRGRTVYSGGDWYWLADGKFHYASSGEWGTWKERPGVSCSSCVKRGDGVGDDEFQRVRREALEAPWP